MTAYRLVWYRHALDAPWACFLDFPPPHTYSRPSEWLKNAEQMMRGDKSDVLWRKCDAAARKLIWC
jgi:hypothetical protein